jgi:hypothetical protein
MLITPGSVMRDCRGLHSGRVIRVARASDNALRRDPGPAQAIPEHRRKITQGVARHPHQPQI